MQILITDNLDLAPYLGVKKWEREYAANGARMGHQGGAFPSFIKKTNQDRIQNIYKYIQRGTYGYAPDDMYEVSEKEDGSSMTVFSYIKEGTVREFGVCSHNFLIKRDEALEGSLRSIFWLLAEKYDIEAKLNKFGRNLAIQGEAVGPGIQKNRLQLKETEFYVFDIWDIDKSCYLPSDERLELCQELDLIHVPVLCYEPLHFNSVQEAVNYAEGKSVLNSDIMREGIVYKSLRNPDASFKIINNKYLLKYDN